MEKWPCLPCGTHIAKSGPRWMLVEEILGGIPCYIREILEPWCTVWKMPTAWMNELQLPQWSASHWQVCHVIPCCNRSFFGWTEIVYKILWTQFLWFLSYCRVFFVLESVHTLGEDACIAKWHGSPLNSHRIKCKWHIWSPKLAIR